MTAYFKIFSIQILLFSLNNVFGQKVTSIRGQVITSTKEPIPYATVIVSDSLKKNIIISSFADGKGYFTVSLADTIFQRNVYISARFLNNLSPVHLVNGDSLIITLDHSIGLEEIIIRTKESLLVQEADRFIYTPNSSLKVGATPLDILQITPFIDFDIKTGVFKIINKEKTIITINNRRTELPLDLLLSTLKTMPASNIINIEIITNPGSEYSGSTTGGVININLKKNLDDGIYSNFSITNEQSILNTAILNGTIDFRKNKFGLRVSPFFNSSFNYKLQNNTTPENNVGVTEELESRYKRRYFVSGGGLGLDYQINDFNLLSFNGFASMVKGKSNYDNKTSFFSNEQKTSLDSIIHSPVHSKDAYFYNFGNVYFESLFKNKNKITLNIDYNQFKKDNTDSGYFNKNLVQQDFNNFFRNNILQNFINLSTNIDFLIMRKGKNRMLMGLQSSVSNVNSKPSYYFFNTVNEKLETNTNLTNTFQYSEKYIAAYYTASQQIRKNISLNIGLRSELIDYISKNITQKETIDSSYLVFLPSLSLNYNINSKNSFSFSFSKKINRPTFQLLMPGRTYYNQNYFSENNPFLQPVLFYNSDLTYTMNNRYYFTISNSFSYNQFNRLLLTIEEDKELKQKNTYVNYGNENKTSFQVYTKQNFASGIWEMNFSGTLVFLHYSNKIGIPNINNINYNFFTNNVIQLSKEKRVFSNIIMRYYSPIENIFFRRDNNLFKCDFAIRKSWNRATLSLYLSDIFNTFSHSTTIYKHIEGIQFLNIQTQTDFTKSISATFSFNLGNRKTKSVKSKNNANNEVKNRL